jgi:GNAT superfamily N-acetyltransferase
MRRADTDDMAALHAMYDLGVAETERTHAPGSFALPAFVALNGDRVVGMIQIEPVDDTGYLFALFVRSEHRCCGAGRALIAAAADYAIRQGCSRLAVDPYAWNSAALKFYQRIGFQP